MNKNLFRLSRRIMGKALNKDGGLYIAYQSNIAMLLHDRYGIEDYAKRNKAAEEILSLIFNILPQKT